MGNIGLDLKRSRGKLEREVERGRNYRSRNGSKGLLGASRNQIHCSEASVWSEIVSNPNSLMFFICVCGGKNVEK